MFSNLYLSLPYYLSYNLYQKTSICINKTPFNYPEHKLMTLKSFWISCKLIYFLAKECITQSPRQIPKRIWEVMRNQSSISLCVSKFNIFFLLLHYIMESLVHTIGIYLMLLLERVKPTRHTTSI